MYPIIFIIVPISATPQRISWVKQCKEMESSSLSAPAKGSGDGVAERIRHWPGWSPIVERQAAAADPISCAWMAPAWAYGLWQPGRYFRSHGGCPALPAADCCPFCCVTACLPRSCTWPATICSRVSDDGVSAAHPPQGAVHCIDAVGLVTAAAAGRTGPLAWLHRRGNKSSVYL